MRKILSVVCVLGLPCVSLAQHNQASWANLSVLHSGQKIQIVDTASKKHSGIFTGLTETSLSYTQNETAKSIPKQDVRSVKLMENKHRLRNTLIVAAAGAGVGAGIGAATHKPCPSSQSFCLDIGGKALPAGIGAVIGGIGGAAVGALLPSHSTLYDISPP
jgi:hypothetical protein